MMSNEPLGIFEDLQSKSAIYLPKRPKEARHGPSISERRETILNYARQAVDIAIKEAIAAEVQRRRDEIEGIYSPTGPDVADLIQAIATASGLTTAILQGTDRRREISWARALFWYIAAALRRDLSLPKLGHMLGGKDHTSVLAALRRFPKRRSEEPLASYCAHPAVAVYLASADETPRKSRADK